MYTQTKAYFKCKNTVTLPSVYGVTFGDGSSPKDWK